MFRHPLFLSLLVFLALGAALVARVPMGASPDEAAHWQYIEYLVANKSLPLFTGQKPPLPGYEFHQPPLYYAIAAPGWAVLPAGVQNYWARLVSLLCGAATLIFIWKSARLLFADDRSIAVLATGFAALWPLHLGVSAGSNNDALGGLWAAALFWCGARVLLRGATLRDAALMGLLVGLGALTKNTVLVVGAAMLVALLVAPSAPKSPSGFVRLLVALAVTIVVAGPLWARNIFVYGDPFVLRLFSKAAAEGTPGFPYFAQLGLDFLTYARGMIWMIFLTMWGFFGGSDTASKLTAPLNPGGPIVRDLWLAPLMLIFLLVPLAVPLGWRRYAESAPLQGAQKRVLLYFVVGALLVFLAWVQFAYAHFSGGQARYFHAALLPMCVFAATGWRGMWGTGRALHLASWPLAALLLTMTLLNLLVWKTLV